SNLAFAGDDPLVAIPRLAGRTWNTHVKNGHVDAQGGWHFGPLDHGLTDYAAVLPLLAAARYDGYLTIECLGPAAAAQPHDVARRDRDILRRYLDHLGLAEERV
ncbi:MAG: hypothetical protein GX557_06920, partial [Chloroflexi bacterium]|nr:hypothetical protein [Chloroflexota bacterium]